MDPPPQVVVILFGALVICSGPILLAGGILDYTGRWTAWAGPSSYPLLSKHSRVAFMASWAGLPLSGADIIIAMDALGLDSGPMRDLMGPAATLCVLMVMMHDHFLPRFLRSVLLPGGTGYGRPPSSRWRNGRKLSAARNVYAAGRTAGEQRNRPGLSQ
jgi:hypothetical protein